MASLVDVFARVRPDTDRFEPELRSKLAKVNADKPGQEIGRRMGGGIGRGIGSVARTVFAPLAAAAAGAGAIKLFSGFVADARESNKIAAITTQVIKTTGGAARVTAQQVSELATAISNKTGVDDEAIQSGANLLLTFTNVRNEVGKGNDIFNQATQTVTDMSAALGQDSKASAIQLGKALNDPIKGVTALQRVGVSFTQKQKDQIKALVESGRTLDAQKIILRELGKEFGGTAQAASTPMDKLRVIVGNLGEQIGNYLIPYIDKAANFIGQRIVPAVSQFFEEMRTGEGTGGRFVEMLREFAARLVDTGKWIARNRDVLVPLVAAVAGAVAVFKVVTSVIKVWRAAQVLLNIVMSANPIGIVIVAVGALVAAIVIAYKKSETFRDIVKGTWKVVQTAISVVWNYYYKPILSAIGKALQLGWGYAQTYYRIVAGAFKLVGDAFSNVWTKVLKPTFKFLTEAFLAVAGSIVNGAARAFGWVPGIGDKLKDGARAFNTFRDNVNKSLNGVTSKTVTVTAGFVADRSRKGQALPLGLGSGGKVLAGTTSRADDVHALLSRGEFVVNAAATARHEHLLRQINANRFADGGLVPRVRLPNGKMIDNASEFGFLRFARTQASAIAAALRPLLGAPVGANGWAFPLPRGSYAVGVGLNGYPGHTGQDFPAPRGTKVFAPFAGMFTPVRLGNRSYGNYANVVAGPWRSIQAHLMGFARGAGFVDAGELIGYVNSTGNSTGNHLHQEFRKNGSVIDPRRVLSFDTGRGVLQPGWNLAHNGTGRPEPLAPAGGMDEGSFARAMRRALEGMTLVMDDRGRGRLTARTADLYARGG